jgi:hypothetical protein
MKFCVEENDCANFSSTHSVSGEQCSFELFLCFTGCVLNAVESDCLIEYAGYINMSVKEMDEIVA